MALSVFAKKVASHAHLLFCQTNHHHRWQQMQQRSVTLRWQTKTMGRHHHHVRFVEIWRSKGGLFMKVWIFHQEQHAQTQRVSCRSCWVWTTPLQKSGKELAAPKESFWTLVSWMCTNAWLLTSTRPGTLSGHSMIQMISHQEWQPQMARCWQPVHRKWSHPTLMKQKNRKRTGIKNTKRKKKCGDNETKLPNTRAVTCEQNRPPFFQHQCQAHVLVTLVKCKSSVQVKCEFVCARA